MKRRQVLGILLGAPVAAAMPVMPAIANNACVWGPMTVDRHLKLCRDGVHLHVYRDGRDVTDLCVFFDDTPDCRRAHLLREDARGSKYLDPSTREPAMEWVTEFDVREGEPFRR